MSILAAYCVPHPPIILPEIGRGEEGKIRRTTEALSRIAKEIAQLKPDTIILITPHMVMYQDYFHIAPGKTAEIKVSFNSAGKMGKQNSVVRIYSNATEPIEKVSMISNVLPK